MRRENIRQPAYRRLETIDQLITGSGKLIGCEKAMGEEFLKDGKGYPEIGFPFKLILIHAYLALI